MAGFLVSLAITASFALKIWPVRHATRWIVGIAINGVFVFTGILLYWQEQATNQADWMGHHLNTTKYLLVTPEKIGTTAKKSSRYVFRVLACIKEDGTQKKVTGSFIGYLPKENAGSFLPGDILVFTAENLQSIQSTGNPGSFDFARYSARQNIRHQAFYKSGQFRKIAGPSGFNLARVLAYGQLSAMQSMRTTVPQNSAGLAMALLIGYRNEVDKSLLQAYANTGVVHVIAVSGMHLGLIFLLLQRVLFFPEKRYKIFRWIKALVVLLIIWLFSGIAGAAASIIRAAFMFSVAMLAKLIRKPMDNIQSICLGAFALLCYNPLWIWDAGFQLSFAALLSIICYQPLINTWATPKNPILKNIWELTAVTLSAQVLTLPISIGQFHQAPVYFLASNLLAVPLSSLALVTAIIQWAISATGITLHLAGAATGIFIDMMNAGINHINAIPGAVIDQIEWSASQTITTYLIILGITAWLLKPTPTNRTFSLFAIALFGLLNLLQKQESSQQEILLALHLPRQSAISVVLGKTLQPISRQSQNPPPEVLAATRYFHTRLLAADSASLYRYDSCRIALPKTTRSIQPLLAAKPRYLFLPPTLLQIEPILNSLHPETTLVIDGSIPEWRARQWCVQLRQRKLRYYSTWESGALRIPINKF